LAREEALGRLQQERTALEGAQAALKQQEDEASKLNGELVQLSISHKDFRQSLEEQETTICDLRREAEEARKALEVEKKQVEGGLVSIRFFVCRLVFRGFAPNFFLSSFVAFRPVDHPGKHDYRGRGSADGLQFLSTEVGGAVGRHPRDLPRGGGGRGAGREFAGESPACPRGHVSQHMRRALHLGIKKALGVVASHYQVNFKAMSSGYIVPVGVEDEEAMNRADALAAADADTPAKDLVDLLFPDAPGASDPQA
jgi:hypothetical protein